MEIEDDDVDGILEEEETHDYHYEHSKMPSLPPLLDHNNTAPTPLSFASYNHSPTNEQQVDSHVQNDAHQMQNSSSTNGVAVDVAVDAASDDDYNNSATPVVQVDSFQSQSQEPVTTENRRNFFVSLRRSFCSSVNTIHRQLMNESIGTFFYSGSSHSMECSQEIFTPEKMNFNMNNEGNNNLHN